jgi:hypothetical protein
LALSLLYRDDLVGLPWLTGGGISLRGDGAKLSRWGEIERSKRRWAGRGGTLGKSAPKELAVVAFWSWERAGRGGTWGIAVDIVSVAVGVVLLRAGIDKTKEEMPVSRFSSAIHHRHRSIAAPYETLVKRPCESPCDRVCWCCSMALTEMAQWLWHVRIMALHAAGVTAACSD